jgi:hypothetical protein
MENKYKRITRWFTPMIFFVAVSLSAFGQNGVKIAATSGTADPSAMLDISSTTQGVLIPRMIASQRTAITSPASGLLVFQTDGTPGFYYNAGTPASPNWIVLSAGALSGAGTTNYISKWTSGAILGNSMVFDNGTNIGVGTSATYQTLTILNSTGLYTNNEASSTGIGVLTGTNNSGTQGTQDYVLYMGADKTNDLSYLQSVKWGIATAALVLNARGGNVGIGSATAAYPLDVAGNIRSTTLGGTGYRQVIASPAGVLTTTPGNVSVFNYTGSVQSYVVPAGVTSIMIKLWGAGGGGGYYGGWIAGFSGGAGGFTQGTLTVTPGQTIYLVVGGGGVGGNAQLRLPAMEAVELVVREILIAGMVHKVVEDLRCRLPAVLMF